LNKTYKEWKNAKTTISADKEETIQLPTGIDKAISNTNTKKDTENESNKSDEKVSRAMKKSESWFNPQVTREVGD
jgi:hypothetical protein